MTKPTQKIHSVAIFCGSTIGKDACYPLAAEALARVITDLNIQTIYGGANVGIMGHFANSVLALNGNITGVIPQALLEKKVAHEKLSELIVTSSMTERKATMHKLSDAFIMMPGGLGSLEEFFEVLSWLQLGLHQKPCAIFNVNNYFTPLLRFLDHSADQGFVKPVHRDMIISETEPTKLMQLILEYQYKSLINNNLLHQNLKKSKRHLHQK